MTQWYYRDPQSRKIGPLSTEEFEACIDEGAIQPATRVWRSGLVDWTTYEALIAHDANGHAVTCGPHAGAAPWSSSCSTSVLRGRSAVHHRHDGCGATTPEATPQAARAPASEPCGGCGEEMPSVLFGEMRGRRFCGVCIQEAATKAKRGVSRDAEGGDAHRHEKHLLLVLAILTGLLVLHLFGFRE